MALWPRGFQNATCVIKFHTLRLNVWRFKWNYTLFKQSNCWMLKSELFIGASHGNTRGCVKEETWKRYQKRKYTVSLYQMTKPNAEAIDRKHCGRCITIVLWTSTVILGEFNLCHMPLSAIDSNTLGSHGRHGVSNHLMAQMYQGCVIYIVYVVSI